VKKLNNIQYAEGILKKLILSKTSVIHKFENDNTLKPKIVWKVDGCMQTILYRVVDIAETAIFLWRTGKMIPVIILSRSLMETVSASYWLLHRIERKNNLEEIDQDVMKLYFSSSIVQTLPDPINVLKFIDLVGKHIPNWRNTYDLMSQSVHPNSDGTIFAYTELDKKTGDINFFDNFPDATEWLDKNMPPVLTNSLILMQQILNNYANLRPKLYNIKKSAT